MRMGAASCAAFTASRPDSSGIDKSRKFVILYKARS